MVRLHGTPDGITRCSPTMTLNEKLEYHGWTVTDTGCWEFSGRRNRQGYGALKHGGRYEGAHRWAYRAWIGPIPDRLLIRHKCDNPPCINPDHLELGTTADNMRDAVVRGGYANRKMSDISGERNPMAKLSNQQLDQAWSEFKDGSTYIELARRYGMSYGGMWAAIRRARGSAGLESVVA